MWHWVLHYTGFNDPSGKWSAWWSGFGGDLGQFAGIAVLLRRFNCHARGCWRLGLHHVSGTHFVTCRVHHPDHPARRAATADDIANHPGRNTP